MIETSLCTLALSGYRFEPCDGKMKRTVTEEQLLSYIGSNANT